MDSPAAAAEASAPRRRAPRRFGVLRVVRAFVFLPGTLGLLTGLVALAAVVLAGALVLNVSYSTGPDTGLGPFESVYVALSLVVVSPVAALPDDFPSRVVYVLIPLAGLILLGQVILRLTVTILNRDRWEAAVASTYSDHVLVCGLGRVGFRVVRWLLDLGEEVVVIDLPDDPEHLHEQVRAWGVPVVTADARRVEVLEQAGIRTASALLPITDDDLINLSIATAGRSVRPDLRVVMRTFDDRLASNLQQGFDIYRAYSTSALAAPAFAAAATHAPVDYAFSFGEEGEPQVLMTITRFTVVDESLVIGWTVGRLEAELDVQVLAHHRDHYEQHPSGDTELEVGDSVVVSATSENLDRLSTHTPPTREMGRYHQGRWAPHVGIRQGPAPTAAAEGG